MPENREQAAESPLTQTFVLQEEQLVAERKTEEVGRVTVRTYVEEFPGKLDVDAFREEVEIEHHPVGQVVNQRQAPWEENGVMIIPVYEEQLVVSKQLVLKEQLRIRRVRKVEKHHFENTLRRERVAIEPPAEPGFLHEKHARNGTGHDGADRSGAGRLLKWPFHRPHPEEH